MEAMTIIVRSVYGGKASLLELQLQAPRGVTGEFERLTVASVKAAIEERAAATLMSSWPAERQRIIHNGRVCDDAQELEELIRCGTSGVGAEDGTPHALTLDLVVRKPKASAIVRADVSPARQETARAQEARRAAPPATAAPAAEPAAEPAAPAATPVSESSPDGSTASGESAVSKLQVSEPSFSLGKSEGRDSADPQAPLSSLGGGDVREDDGKAEGSNWDVVYEYHHQVLAGFCTSLRSFQHLEEEGRKAISSSSSSAVPPPLAQMLWDGVVDAAAEKFARGPEVWTAEYVAPPPPTFLVDNGVAATCAASVVDPKNQGETVNRGQGQAHRQPTSIAPRAVGGEAWAGGGDGSTRNHEQGSAGGAGDSAADTPAVHVAAGGDGNVEVVAPAAEEAEEPGNVEQPPERAGHELLRNMWELLDLKLALKTVLLVLLLGQDGDPRKLTKICSAALVVYLIQTGILVLLAQAAMKPFQAGAADNAQAGALPGGIAGMGLISESGGYVGDVAYFVSSFFLSVLPPWWPRALQDVLAEPPQPQPQRNPAEQDAQDPAMDMQRGIM